MAKFEKAQQIVGINEGGFQIDPRDEGNYYQGNLIGTNWGISAPTLAGFLGRVPTKQEMQNLTRQTAEGILKINYWLKNNFDKISNQSVATLIYDGAVNHGTNGMRFLMEKALRNMGYELSYYAVFNATNIAFLNKLNQKKLFYTIKAARQDKYKASSQSWALKGHLNRLERIKYYPDNTMSGIWPYMALVMLGTGVLILAV